MVLIKKYAAAVAIVLAGMSVVAAHAKDAKADNDDEADKPFVYLNDGSIDLRALIPPPPLPDSDEQKAELAEIHRLQDGKSDEIKDRCKMEEKLDAMKIFASVLGDNFTSERLPHVAKLLKSAKSDAKYFISTSKIYWNRDRPPFVDPTLKPGVKLDNKPDSKPSYPSGHSTCGMMYAELLSAMVPEKTKELIPRGEMVGFDRVYAAVHYPSDVVAGRVLGQALSNALLADPKFQSDFDAAKQELRASMQLASK